MAKQMLKSAKVLSYCTADKDLLPDFATSPYGVGTLLCKKMGNPTKGL